MAIVNFYLKNPKAEDETLIYLFFSYDSKRLKCSTGEFINPNSWNEENQRAKKSYTGYSDLNDYLDTIQENIKKIYRNLKTDNAIITSEILREKLLESQNNKTSVSLNFFSFVTEYINSVVSLRKKSSIVVYRNVLKTLKEFESHSKKRINFDSITLDFYNEYSDYLQKVKKFKPNTIGKHFKTIKTFLNEATERGLNKKMDYQSKRFKVIQEDIDSIYLNDSELETLYNLNLSKKKHLEKVRDLFIVGCHTGLRFSDFTQLKPENITNGMIKIRTQKTNSNVVIPVHPKVNEILLKYKNSLPEAFSNQKMNEYLKDIGWEANFIDKVEVVDFKEGERVITFAKKYELITTHTARRSFATNLFKAGFPAISIMKITGHKTEKAFMRYIKITEEQNADLLAEFWNKKN